jgi:hypothetical protein
MDSLPPKRWEMVFNDLQFVLGGKRKRHHLKEAMNHQLHQRMILAGVVVHPVFLAEVRIVHESEIEGPRDKNVVPSLGLERNEMVLYKVNTKR